LTPGRTERDTANQDFLVVLTVLVVDDEEPLRRYLARVMEDEGYRVLTAGGGLEALAVIEQSPTKVDLVITDVLMPGMSGIELANRLAAMPVSPPVLFTSGSHINVPGPLVKKPFLPDDLRLTARWVLHSGKRPLLAS
jgi:two-component system cell cycle sensor histidine kinase/response regulator CckA